MDGAYIPIDRHTIRMDAVQKFDVFFPNDGRLALYSAGGHPASEEVLNRIREKPLEKLYILKRDWTAYNLYVEENLDGVFADAGITPERKAAVAYHSILFIAEQLFRNPRADLIHRYKKAVIIILKHAMDDPVVLRGLIGMTTFDFSVYNHSINVGIFSVGLLREFMAAESIPNVGEVAAAFFLHDIGKCRVPVDILHKKGPLSKVEWMCMRNHVEEGVKILDECRVLNRESEIIVSQHHERSDGSGYPRGLRGDSIHPYARICSIADVFDGLTSYRPYRKEHSSFDAMMIMRAEMFKDLDPIHFQKFVRLFSGQ